MKVKKLIILLNLALIAILGTGCKREENQITEIEKETENIDNTISALVEEKKGEESKGENIAYGTINNNSENTNTSGNVNKNNVTSEVVNVIATKILMDDNVYTYLVVTGYDNKGNEVWSYTTEKVAMAELETVELLESDNNIVYINEMGKIHALDKQTGKSLWINSDYQGASSAYAISKDGTLYIMGYYGAYVYVINSKGETMKTVKIPEDLLEPESMYIDGEELVVNLTDPSVNADADDTNVIKDDGAVITINIKDYSIKRLK